MPCNPHAQPRARRTRSAWEDDRSPALLATVIEADIIPRLLVAHRDDPIFETTTSAFAEITMADVDEIAPLVLSLETTDLLRRVEAVIARGVSHKSGVRRSARAGGATPGRILGRRHLRFPRCHDGPVALAGGCSRNLGHSTRRPSRSGATCAVRAGAGRTAQLRGRDGRGVVPPFGLEYGERQRRSPRRTRGTGARAPVQPDRPDARLRIASGRIARADRRAARRFPATDRRS